MTEFAMKYPWAMVAIVWFVCWMWVEIMRMI